MQRDLFIKMLFIVAMILCATDWVIAPVALVAGFVFTLLFGHPFPHLNGKATSLLLKASVVGLGFGMSMNSVLEVGYVGLQLTVISIVFVLLLGYFFGKRLRMSARSSHLIASGTAICGGSAIAAVAPVIKAADKDVSVSLGVIFFLNSIALLVFPILGHLFNLTQYQFGLWSAIAIHDTSSVVGAASAYGEEALGVAITVKLARTLWIIPVSLISAWFFRGKGRSVSLPWFIVFFILAILANTYFPVVSYFNAELVDLAKRALVVTLFLIGTSLSISSLKSVGAKPFILGIILWIVVSILSLIAILLLY
ncbi:MAG: putative sulfate exporter family transporter [Bacteroidales bacterium]|nr:putative sulfate exporter family transporter [Bacteroidales bacterium]MDD4822416.1 putative sulfate exporter family transporter [Bacteroidales bacterium]